MGLGFRPLSGNSRNLGTWRVNKLLPGQVARLGITNAEGNAEGPGSVQFSFKLPEVSVCLSSLFPNADG